LFDSVVVELRAICGTATNNPLTCLNTSGNSEADFPFNLLKIFTKYS
jgi:hypothetical protein